MNLALLGDSIFDNQSYVTNGQSVQDQIATLFPVSRITLLARDGATASDVGTYQLKEFPDGVTHCCLSAGGNDALRAIGTLNDSVVDIRHALDLLSQLRIQFQQEYAALLAQLVGPYYQLVICTIYDQKPTITSIERTIIALFNDIILSQAIGFGLPVIDLRRVCTLPTDFSEASPIEPSADGGKK